MGDFLVSDERYKNDIGVEVQYMTTEVVKEYLPKVTEEEIAAAKGAIRTLGGKIVKVEDYTIPTSGVTHRVVVIEKVSPTPPRYPRAFAKIKKQPL